MYIIYHHPLRAKHTQMVNGVGYNHLTTGNMGGQSRLAKTKSSTSSSHGHFRMINKAGGMPVVLGCHYLGHVLPLLTQRSAKKGRGL